MKASEKDRDPAKAKKRAVADARCALRKLDLLAELETFDAKQERREPFNAATAAEINDAAFRFAAKLAEALKVQP